MRLVGNIKNLSGSAQLYRYGCTLQMTSFAMDKLQLHLLFFLNIGIGYPADPLMLGKKFNFAFDILHFNMPEAGQVRFHFSLPIPFLKPRLKGR